ncbi:MAG: hypothetical protein WD207_05905 [Xanthobacteraceae bacterium]
MFSVSSANQTFNLVLAMSLTALATAASIELRTQPADLLAELQQRWTEIRTSYSAEAAIDQTPATSKDASRVEPAAASNSEPEEIPLAVAPAPFVPINSKIAAAVAEPSAAPAPAGETAAVAASAAAGASGGVPAAPTKAKLAALPAKPGIIFEDVGHKACIGGVGCEGHCKIETGGCVAQPAYAIKLDQPAYISAVQLYAHDQVGPSRRSELIVKVNGEPVGAAEVHRYGSTRTIKVGRVGQLVTVESRHQHNGFLRGGEEAVIWDVYLLGRKPR